MTYRAVAIGCAAILSLLLTGLSEAQQTPQAQQNDRNLKGHSWTDDCSYEDHKIVCSVKQDEPEAIGPLQVPNSSLVVIRVINKSPFDDCVLGDIKTTEIKPSDPIVSILQMLTKAVSGPLPSALSDKSESIGKKTTKTPADSLYLDLKAMQKKLTDKADEATSTVQTNYAAAVNVDQLFSKPPRSNSEYNSNSAESIGAIEQTLKDRLADGEPSLESEQLQQAIFRDRLKDILTKGPQGTVTEIAQDKETISDDATLFDSISGQIAGIKANYDAVSAAHVQFRAILSFLYQVDNAVKKSSPNPFQKDIPILPFVQQTASTTVACSNSYSKKATPQQIPVTILYQKDPALSVSVGPLLSTIEKQKLGTTPVSTGLDSSGKPTFKSEFAIVDHAPVQVVPFAFLNYRLYDFSDKENPAKLRPVTLNASLGVGVNPNSGTNEPEFFAGMAIGFKKLMVQLGDHIGRFQQGFTGGFNVGDTVPANFPSTLPIHKVYRNGFGIALSYRLPL
jgi:hypothetical protein